MPRIYSVSDVNSYIKNMLDTDPVMSRITVAGELSNVKYHSSGHIYFSLKDQTGTLKAVMFAGYARSLKFRLVEGQKVNVTGSISVYEAGGSYQLYAHQIEKAGDGELYARYLALKKELEEMGMFDQSYKKDIPRYARRIGIVTAATGAAIQDIINISTRRNPYVQLVLYPAQVQGKGAEVSICQGIEYLDTYGNVDIIIVGRGGGSIEDLWCFNEESVARAIFACETPVISAVGHEVDYTIADFVADLRAPTPSAAAELAVFDYQTVADRLEMAKKLLLQHLSDKAEEVDRQIAQYERRIRPLMDNCLQNTGLQLSQYERRIRPLMNNCLQNTGLQLSQYEKRLNLASPMHRIEVRQQQLDGLEDSLKKAMKVRLEEARHEFALRAARLEANSPLKKLKSGFSYVTGTDGAKTKVIRSVTEVKVEDQLKIYVTDGSVTAMVTGTQTQNRGNQ